MPLVRASMASVIQVPQKLYSASKSEKKDLRDSELRKDSVSLHRSPIEKLPEELLINILVHLEHFDLDEARGVNKQWSRLAKVARAEVPARTLTSEVLMEHAENASLSQLRRIARHHNLNLIQSGPTMLFRSPTDVGVIRIIKRFKNKPPEYKIALSKGIFEGQDITQHGLKAIFLDGEGVEATNIAAHKNLMINNFRRMNHFVAERPSSIYSLIVDVPDFIKKPEVQEILSKRIDLTEDDRKYLEKVMNGEDPESM